MREARKGSTPADYWSLLPNNMTGNHPTAKTGAKSVEIRFRQRNCLNWNLFSANENWCPFKFTLAA